MSPDSVPLLPWQLAGVHVIGVGADFDVRPRVGPQVVHPRRVLGRTSERADDQHLAVDRQVGLAKTIVNGGAIAIGHPLGASSARIMTTLVNALEQQGGRCGLQTMCEGGGMASATIIERLG